LYNGEPAVDACFDGFALAEIDFPVFEFRRKFHFGINFFEDSARQLFRPGVRVFLVSNNKRF
jgi:hypothetical protein